MQVIKVISEVSEIGEPNAFKRFAPERIVKHSGDQLEIQLETRCLDPIKLLNCRTLSVHNWITVLPKDLRAGETVVEAKNPNGG